MSQHRRPPAVRFPLTEHRAPAVALFLALLGGVAVLLLWRWQQDFRAAELRIVWWAAWLWLAATALMGWRWWHALARGWLLWTGEHWLLRTAGDAASLQDAPRWQRRVTLDWQFAVLLRLEPVAAGTSATSLSAARSPRPRWVWAQRTASPATWQGLRQALVWSQQQQGKVALSPELSA